MKDGQRMGFGVYQYKWRIRLKIGENWFLFKGFSILETLGMFGLSFFRFFLTFFPDAELLFFPLAFLTKLFSFYPGDTKPAATADNSLLKYHNI